MVIYNNALIMINIKIFVMKFLMKHNNLLKKIMAYNWILIIKIIFGIIMLMLIYY